MKRARPTSCGRIRTKVALVSSKLIHPYERATDKKPDSSRSILTERESRFALASKEIPLDLSTFDLKWAELRFAAPYWQPTWAFRCSTIGFARNVTLTANTSYNIRAITIRIRNSLSANRLIQNDFLKQSPWVLLKWHVSFNTELIAIYNIYFLFLNWQYSVFFHKVKTIYASLQVLQIYYISVKRNRSNYVNKSFLRFSRIEITSRLVYQIL